MLLQEVLRGVCCGDLFCVLTTLLASVTPNRVGAHNASLADQAMSLGRSLAGQCLSKVPLSCVNWVCQVARMAVCACSLRVLGESAGLTTSWLVSTQMAH